MAIVLPLRQQPVGKENGEVELAVHPAASQQPRTTKPPQAKVAQRDSGSLTATPGADRTTLQLQLCSVHQALPDHTPPHDISLTSEVPLQERLQYWLLYFFKPKKALFKGKGLSQPKKGVSISY